MAVDMVEVATEVTAVVYIVKKNEWHSAENKRWAQCSLKVGNNKFKTDRETPDANNLMRFDTICTIPVDPTKKGAETFRLSITTSDKETGEATLPMSQISNQKGQRRWVKSYRRGDQKEIAQIQLEVYVTGTKQLNAKKLYKKTTGQRTFTDSSLDVNAIKMATLRQQEEIARETERMEKLTLAKKGKSTADINHGSVPFIEKISPECGIMTDDNALTITGGNFGIDATRIASITVAGLEHVGKEFAVLNSEEIMVKVRKASEPMAGPVIINYKNGKTVESKTPYRLIESLRRATLCDDQSPPPDGRLSNGTMFSNVGPEQIKTMSSTELTDYALWSQRKIANLEQDLSSTQEFLNCMMLKVATNPDLMEMLSDLHHMDFA
eukprot:Clim_evm98s25 gene=Clim_evmTU98s25